MKEEAGGNRKGMDVDPDFPGLMGALGRNAGICQDGKGRGGEDEG